MQYIVLTHLPQEEKQLENLITLHKELFHTTAESFLKGIKEKNKLLILLALHHNQIIGYKIGYERKQHHFYSWLGGVHKDYRKQGIASKLMDIQHNWCQEHGYKTIQTKTKNKWRNMLILNIKHGFDVIGTYTDEKGEPKIILEKRL